MKRRIALLLVICLLTSMVPAATAGGAVDDAIPGNGIEIVDVGDQDLSAPLVSDGIELETTFSPDELGNILTEGDVPETEVAMEAIVLDDDILLSPDISATDSGASVTADANSDFDIDNGVLIKYRGSDIDVVVPLGVTRIGEYAFAGNRDIISVTLPKGVTSIATFAFADCSGLTSVTLPQGLTTIEHSAFLRCPRLVIVLPQSVSKIEEGAFNDCKKVSLAAGNRHYIEIDGLLFTADKRMIIYGQSTLQNIGIPEGTERIGNSAFNSIYHLKSVSIPRSVTSIGESAFSSCMDLLDIKIPNSVTSIGMSAFDGCYSLSSLTVPGSLKAIERDTFRHCEGLRNVTILDGVQEIGELAFGNCQNLESITIPASVTEIGWHAIYTDGKVKIKGYKGSCAESYAKEYGMVFESIGKATVTPSPKATPTPTPRATSTPAPTVSPTPKNNIPGRLTLGVKETYALDAAGASFKSSNTAVATVDEKGVVTAKKAGNATVTVTVGGKKAGSCKVTVVKAPANISFAEKAVTLGVKETLALKPTITKGSHTSYTWSVKDKKIATVDKDGVVTGKKAGKTTVTVKTHNGKKATVTVTVQKAPTKVSLPKKAVTLGVKEALTLTPKIAKGAHTSFTWTVADSKIATVTKSGKVTGKKAGETTVTVKTHNGKKATVTVTVMKAPTAVSLEAKTMALGVKESVKLKPEIARDAHTSYTWTVKDKKIATVTKDGKLTGVKAGKTTVTVKTHNGKKATMTVNVMAAPGSITLSGKSRKLTVGDAIMLMPTLPKKTASRITWSSSKKSVASVDASGVVRALKKGTAKITAKTFNGKKAVCTVTVGEGASYLAFEAETLSVGVKEKVTLKPRVNEGAKVKYTWTTGDKKVATVSSKGVVTGVKAGSTDVTVKTQNGLTATVKVTVLAAPSKVTLNKTKAELPESQTLQLTATLPKKTASRIQWSTSDKKVATVDETGLVTAVAVGEATITAQTFNGKKANCVVTVHKATDADHLESFWDVYESSDQVTLDTKDMTVKMLSPSDFKDSEGMAEFIEEYNGLAVLINENSKDFLDIVDKMEHELSDFVDSIGVLNIQATKDTIQIKTGSYSFTIPTDFSAIAANKGMSKEAFFVSNVGGPSAEEVEPKNIKAYVKSAQEFVDKIGKFVSGCSILVDAEDAKLATQVDYYRNLRDTIKTKLKSKDLTIEDRAELNKKLKDVVAKYDNWKNKRIDFKNKILENLEKFKAKQIEIGLALGSDLAHAGSIIIIFSHKHPKSGREKDDAVRIHHVTLLDEYMGEAAKYIGFDVLYNVAVIATELMLFGKGGLIKSLGTNAAKKMGKKYFILSGEKWAKVAFSGGTLWGGSKLDFLGKADKASSQAEHEDDILHGEIRGTISGKVIDADTKKPIAGALVETDEKSKTTKADGSFVLSAMYGDYSGDYAVKCTKEGYEDGTGEVVVDEDNSDVEVTITIANNGEGTIKGKVVDKITKKPLSGVKVECEYCDTVTSDSNGQFTIKKVPMGNRELIFSKKNYVTEKLTVQVEAGKETPANMAMRLNVGTVKGKVYDNATNKPLKGASVTIKNVATVTTDSKGQYTIEKVPVGKQGISFDKENYISDSKTVEVILDVIVPLNMYLKPKDGTIKGTVYDELTKEPLSDVRISCKDLSKSVTTDLQGRYIIENVPVGKYDITFEKKNFVTATWKTVPVEPNQVTPLDVNLRPEMGTIKGTVVDALTEKALSGVRVESEGYDPVTTDSSGSFTFTDVRVGDRSVSFAKEKYHSTSVAVTVVDGGITSFDLPLVPLLGAVGGIVKDDNNKPMQGVSVTCEGHQEYAAVTDSNGMFLIDNVRIGSYTFVFKADNCDNEKAEVEIIQDTTTSLNITMKLHRGNVAGTVFDYDTKQPLSGVYVISEDGISATTDSNGQYLLEGLVVGSRMIYYSLDRYKSDSMRVNVVKDFTIKQNMELMATIMFFGHYEQDNDTSNGKESIEWIVIGRDSSSVKLLSKAILDGRTYNDMNDFITWEKSNLRTWLNDDFLKAAFTGAEQDRIQTTQVPAPTNPVYTHTDAGGATVDKVYLLSASEAKSVFPDLDIYDRIGNISSYAADKGCMGEWWLRSPGQSPNSAAYVDGTGQINYDGIIVIAGKAGSLYGGFVYGVRPVISLRRS